MKVPTGLIWRLAAGGNMAFLSLSRFSFFGDLYPIVLSLYLIPSSLNFHISDESDALMYLMYLRAYLIACLFDIHLVLLYPC